MFIWEKHYPGHRDLVCQQARSRYTGKHFVSYERSVTFHIIFIPRRDLLVNLSKSFLANRDNVCLYEQALNPSAMPVALSLQTNIGSQIIFQKQIEIESKYLM